MGQATFHRVMYISPLHVAAIQLATCVKCDFSFPDAL